MSHIEETMKRLRDEGITAYLKNPKTGVIKVMPRGMCGPVLTYHVGSGTIDGFILRKGLDALVDLAKKLQSVARDPCHATVMQQSCNTSCNT